MFLRTRSNRKIGKIFNMVQSNNECLNWYLTSVEREVVVLKSNIRAVVTQITTAQMEQQQQPGAISSALGYQTSAVYRVFNKCSMLYRYILTLTKLLNNLKSPGSQLESFSDEKSWPVDHSYNI